MPHVSASRNYVHGQICAGSPGPAGTAEALTSAPHSTLITPAEGISRSGLITAEGSRLIGRRPVMLMKGGCGVVARRVAVSSLAREQAHGRVPKARKTTACRLNSLVSISRCCRAESRVMVSPLAKGGGNAARGG